MIDWIIAHQNEITAGLVVVGYAFAILRAFIAWTATQEDDKLLVLFDERLGYVKTLAGDVYAKVEALVKSGTLTKENKYVKFMELIRTEYEIIHNKPIPQVLQAVAVAEAGIKAASEKVSLQVEQIKASVKGEIGPNTVSNVATPMDNMR
jgi:hypothetical protein